MNREKVKLQLNVPQILTLTYNPPDQPRPGQWGDQYMYWLEDEKTLWAEPLLHLKIVATGATGGDTILVKKLKGNWQVQRVDPRDLAKAHGAIEASAELARELPAPPAKVRSLPALVPLEKRLPPEKFAAADTLNPRNISGNMMASALQQAIEACSLAKFAGTSEDVRALAITIFIQASGGTRK